MNKNLAVFRFEPTVSMDDVWDTLNLAQLAACSLHGEDRVRLQSQVKVDRDGHVVEIDTGGEVGQTLALIFSGYVRREFGVSAVTTGEIMANSVSPGQERLA